MASSPLLLHVDRFHIFLSYLVPFSESLLLIPMRTSPPPISCRPALKRRKPAYHPNCDRGYFRRSSLLAPEFSDNFSDLRNVCFVRNLCLPEARHRVMYAIQGANLHQ